MRLYVIGPVTGHAANNLPAFLDAKNRLMREGYAVGIPHDFIDSACEWRRAMRTSIRHLVEADGVALLPNWNVSRGASLECEIATRIGIPTTTVEGWVRKARER